ncbi:MAG: MBL fold metallo-hydrolase, partial [Dehalococcoidia bacterium]|nr:MBL fold metallo-hydrolase [Dehalococcoidia bacterium]
MAPGPRLYVLDVGSIGVKNGAAVPAGRGRDMYRVPVAAYVITHPAGNVLYDTGMDVGTIDNPAAVWGSLLDRLVPYMREEDHILRRLQSIGLSPRDISYVFLSHLHCDHAGGIRLFPDAEFVLQRTELETPIPEEMSLFYPEPYRDARYDG